MVGDNEKEDPYKNQFDYIKDLEKRVGDLEKRICLVDKLIRVLRIGRI